jgi:bZIP transcription factor
MIMNVNNRLPSSQVQAATESVASFTATIVEDYEKQMKQSQATRNANNSYENSSGKPPSPAPSSSSNDDVDDDAGYASIARSSDREENAKRAREVDMSAEELLEERRSKNRLSAHHSRLRKRRQLKYLEHQVLLLTEENKKLATASQTLSQELAAARAENAQLRLMQQDAVRLATALRLAQGGVGGGMFNRY